MGTISSNPGREQLWAFSRNEHHGLMRSPFQGIAVSHASVSMLLKRLQHFLPSKTSPGIVVSVPTSRWSIAASTRLGIDETIRCCRRYLKCILTEMGHHNVV